MLIAETSFHRVNPTMASESSLLLTQVPFWSVGSAKASRQRLTGGGLGQSGGARGMPSRSNFKRGMRPAG